MTVKSRQILNKSSVFCCIFESHTHALCTLTLYSAVKITNSHTNHIIMSPSFFPVQDGGLMFFSVPFVMYVLVPAAAITTFPPSLYVIF